MPKRSTRKKSRNAAPRRWKNKKTGVVFTEKGFLNWNKDAKTRKALRGFAAKAGHEIWLASITESDEYREWAKIARAVAPGLDPEKVQKAFAIVFGPRPPRPGEDDDGQPEGRPTNPLCPCSSPEEEEVWE